MASSLVIYMKSTVEIGSLRVGRKIYHTERYDCDRGKRVKE